MKTLQGVWDETAEFAREERSCGPCGTTTEHEVYDTMTVCRVCQEMTFLQQELPL